MKRVLSLALVTGLLVSLTACSGGTPKSPATTHTDAPTKQSVAAQTIATAATAIPTNLMTTMPTTEPTVNNPTVTSTMAPTTAPTTVATKAPTTEPTKAPTTAPTAKPTKAPTVTTAAICTHSNTEWVIEKDATCTEVGKKQEVCTLCKVVLREAEIGKAEHSYTSYKCSVCGAIREGGLNGYLADWVQKNGKVNGDTVSLDFYIDDVLYGFTYNATGGYFYFSLLDENYNDFLSMKFTEKTGVYELAYIQGTEPNTREVYGRIDAAGFTENTPITVEEYLGNSDGRSGAVENCRICTCLLLESIETAFDEYDVGLTLQDLGFTALQ